MLKKRAWSPRQSRRATAYPSKSRVFSGAQRDDQGTALSQQLQKWHKRRHPENRLECFGSRVVRFRHLAPIAVCPRPNVGIARTTRTQRILFIETIAPNETMAPNRADNHIWDSCRHSVPNFTPYLTIGDQIGHFLRSATFTGIGMLWRRCWNTYRAISTPNMALLV